MPAMVARKWCVSRLKGLGFRVVGFQGLGFQAFRVWSGKCTVYWENSGGYVGGVLEPTAKSKS